MIMHASTFPEWIRRSWPMGKEVKEVKELLEGLHLHTVCQSAHCPNQAECWTRRTATLMILGNACTRHCRFCAVNPGTPPPMDPDEPENVAEVVARLGLRHAVITSVTRDDLPDGGADHFARTITAIKERTPETTVEVLTPDFSGDPGAIGRVLEASPAVFGHNLETVRRLHPVLRDPRSSYERSLEVLRTAAARATDTFVKSGLMVGCGETAEEVRGSLEDLRRAGCSVVSIGQYLRPTPKHFPVCRNGALCSEFIPLRGPDAHNKG